MGEAQARAVPPTWMPNYQAMGMQGLGQVPRGRTAQVAIRHGAHWHHLHTTVAVIRTACCMQLGQFNLVT